MILLSALPMLSYTFFALKACFIDIREHRLPNRLVFWATLTPIVTALVGVLLSQSLSRFQHALEIALLGMLIFGLLHLLSRGQLGLGDVKFAFPCSYIVGWYSSAGLLFWIWVSFAIAAIFALIEIRRGMTSRHDFIAFGPFMFVGVFLTVLIKP